MQDFFLYYENLDLTGSIIRSLCLLGMLLSIISFGIFKAKQKLLSVCFLAMFIQQYFFPVKVFNTFPVFVFLYLIIQRKYNGLLIGSICIFPISINFFRIDLDILIIELMISMYVIALYYLFFPKYRHPVFSIYLILTVNAIMTFNTTYIPPFTLILLLYLILRNIKISWLTDLLLRRRTTIQTIPD